jgi:hypothetical protein
MQAHGIDIGIAELVRGKLGSAAQITERVLVLLPKVLEARVVEVAEHGPVACMLHGARVLRGAPQLHLVRAAASTGRAANKGASTAGLRACAHRMGNAMQKMGYGSAQDRSQGRNRGASHSLNCSGPPRIASCPVMCAAAAGLLRVWRFARNLAWFPVKAAHLRTADDATSRNEVA